jgi:hypothetical protein
VIGVRAGQLIRALWPALMASAVMAAGVLAIDSALPPLAPLWRLALLVAAGAVLYGATLLLAARGVIDELIGLLRRRPAPAN